MQGQTYGIPTKNSRLRSLSLKQIKHYVNNFIRVATERQDLKFLVTEIGCGLAGFTPTDIGPMFHSCRHLENVYLPSSFQAMSSNEKETENTE